MNPTLPDVVPPSRAMPVPGRAWRRTSAANVAKEGATLSRACPTLRHRRAKGPAVQGLPMRRRGLEPPPRKPGPGPQPGNPSVTSVLIAPDRPFCPRIRTIRTYRTLWMLPRMLPRATGTMPPNAACMRSERYLDVGSRSRPWMLVGGRLTWRRFVPQDVITATGLAMVRSAAFAFVLFGLAGTRGDPRR